jgi:hypothetical protein
LYTLVRLDAATRLIEAFDGAADRRVSQADERFISFANEYLCPGRLSRRLSNADDAEDYRTWRAPCSERRSSAILQFRRFAVAMLRTAQKQEGKGEGGTDETNSSAAAAAAASWLHIARTNME